MRARTHLDSLGATVPRMSSMVRVPADDLVSTVGLSIDPRPHRILRAFQKKARRGIVTPKQELDLVRHRLQAAERHYRDGRDIDSPAVIGVNHAMRAGGCDGFIDAADADFEDDPNSARNDRHVALGR